MADAAPAVGMGHVSRCSAVAAAFDGPVRCLAYDAPGPLERDGVAWEPWSGPLTALDAPVAVIDGYRFDTIAEVDGTVAIFHDGGPIPDRVALVIAPIAGGPEPITLSGLEHACLRRDFWDLPPHTGGAGVLLTCGAGPEGDALAEAVLAHLGPPVTVVRGAASNLTAPSHATLLTALPSLRDVLLNACVVIATGGQTALEAAACGTPAVLLALDEAQAGQAARLQRAGAAITVPSAEQAARTAIALLDDDARRRELSAAGRATVDGRGAHRVAAALSRLRAAAA